MSPHAVTVSPENNINQAQSWLLPCKVPESRTVTGIVNQPVLSVGFPVISNYKLFEE